MSCNAVRYCYLILDVSAGGLRTDVLPNRLVAVLKAAVRFIDAFLWSNALSYVGVIVTSDGLARVLSPLSITPAAPKHHLKTLIDALTGSASKTTDMGLLLGSPSVENSLRVLLRALHDAPSGMQEAVYVSTSLHTCDPGDVFDAIQCAVDRRLTVNVVAFGGEVHVLTQLAKRTGGAHEVPLNEKHLGDIMRGFAIGGNVETGKPLDGGAGRLVPMGFPTVYTEESSVMEATCVCHGKVSRVGFQCPRCRARQCTVPCTCSVCGLDIVPNAHVARTSFQMNKPVKFESDVGAEQGGGCGMCGSDFVREGGGSTASSSVWRCPTCRTRCCSACTDYVHNTLFVCPGCL